MEYNVQHTSVNLQIVQSHGIRAFVYVYTITLPFRGARCPETVVAKIYTSRRARGNVHIVTHATQ